ncbi:MAG: ABC transporter permease [Verrucomicrobia bacterium]|nr:ABC transporter permease [Verrucomicrobiota bacterium]
MNAYLRKEIRLLLPSFGIALVMALSVWLIPPYSNQGQSRWLWLIIFPMLLCPALLVMMALDSFGREISSNTLANLLAQPISRTRIWWTKTSLLATALLAVFGVWWFSLLMHLPAWFSSNPEGMDDMFMAATLLVLTVFSGGLCSVLIFRQVGAAFWFTLIVPAALAMLTGYCTDKFGDVLSHERNITVVLVTYSIAGYFWARRLFLRAQDVHWTGGNIALPAWFKLPRMFAQSAKLAGRRPRLALIVKEFQLHQSQFIIAGVLALLHLTMIVLRHSYAGLKEAWALEFVAFQFWTLWVVMPLLIGCAAVAEERKLGTLEGQLCLPARRRTQFVIKFGVALGLALFFGFVMPLLFEGGRILPDFSSSFGPGRLFSNGFFSYEDLANNYLTIIKSVLPFLPLLVTAVVFFVIAFYASTLGRNTLQAIGPSILGIIIVWALLLGAMNIEDIVGYPLWQGGLIYVIGAPVLMISLAWLTYWNFKHVLVGWPVWRRNVIVFFTSLGLVMALTTAIYQRSWELLQRLEPSHGATRIAGTDPVRVSSQGWKVSFLFPDGGAWSAKLAFSRPSLWEAVTGNWRLKNILQDGQFFEGTNWSNVGASARDIIALQRDGSLWVSEKPDEPARAQVINATLLNEPVKLVRYGNDSDWKNLVSFLVSPLALKTNGTLWVIGPTNKFIKTWPGLRAFEPRRLGSDSDWAEITTLGNHAVLHKIDGRTFVHPYLNSSPAETLYLGEGIIAERVPGYDRQEWSTLVTVNRPRGIPVHLGLTRSGMLVIASEYRMQKNRFELVTLNSKIGRETNWVALAGNYGPPVTLKEDGTLWLWDFSDYQPSMQPEGFEPIQIGERSDWRGIVSDFGGLIALASDGSVWYWQLINRGDSGDLFPLLCPSRKPQLIGNIFAKSE